MAELIISEKPSAAQKIAFALADKSPKKENLKSVPYYSLTHKGKDILVGCAVGHLFTVGETKKTTWETFPIFDVDWIPTSEASKEDYSKKYLNVLKTLCKKADSFTVATDYDIEGEVIGLNIIRKICKQKDASRMKFSTLTKSELLESYGERSKTLDWGQAFAGETRHILDFYYGINLTRALTHSVKIGAGKFKLLSSGRVQGPALKIIVDREKEIAKFIPVPFWQIELNGKVKGSEITAMHKEDKFWEKEKADIVMKNVEGAKQGKISKNEKKKFNQTPPFPFDLTSLQLEAYRCFKIKPKHTLEIAQNLYVNTYISYPRTSSQKLPQKLGFKKIFEQLGAQPNYAELSKKILQTKLIPKEGKKTDAAHPSIYPTGVEPENLNNYEAKLYDLIVRRFYSVFAEDAVRETNTLTIDVNSEEFISKGTLTVFKGWHDFYGPYVKIEEKELPPVEVGDMIDIKDILLHSKETKPPNRYTQSSIIHALEKKGLGTKATRAQIVDTLFIRGYVIGDKNIEATKIGIRTVEILLKYCPEILDEQLTRSFEEEMDKIRENKLTEEDVLKDSRELLSKIIEKFRKNEKEIGKELAEANDEAYKAATEIGKCPNCEEGILTLRRGKFGQFIACNNYPDCKTTFNIPRNAKITPTEKICEHCNLPIVLVKVPKKGPMEHCINPDCPSKDNSGEENGNGNGNSAEPSYPEEGMKCPNCGKGKMVLRKSFYGQFLGCDAYPKCKTMMRIVEGKVDTTPISPSAKKFKKSVKKKTVKKKTVKKKAKKK